MSKRSQEHNAAIDQAMGSYGLAAGLSQSPGDEASDPDSTAKWSVEALHRALDSLRPENSQYEPSEAPPAELEPDDTTAAWNAESVQQALEASARRGDSQPPQRETASAELAPGETTTAWDTGIVQSALLANARPGVLERGWPVESAEQSEQPTSLWTTDSMPVLLDAQGAEPDIPSPRQRSTDPSESSAVVAAETESPLPPVLREQVAEQHLLCVNPAGPIRLSLEEISAIRQASLPPERTESKPPLGQKWLLKRLGLVLVLGVGAYLAVRV